MPSLFAEIVLSVFMWWLCWVLAKVLSVARSIEFWHVRFGGNKELCLVGIGTVWRREFESCVLKVVAIVVGRTWEIVVRVYDPVLIRPWFWPFEDSRRFLGSAELSLLPLTRKFLTWDPRTMLFL